MRTASALTRSPGGIVAEAVTVFDADRRGIERQFDAPCSLKRRELTGVLLADWKEIVADLQALELGHDDRADAYLLRNLIRRLEVELDRQSRDLEEIEPVATFAPDLIDLLDAWRATEPRDPRSTAGTLHRACTTLAGLRSAFEDALRHAEAGLLPRPTVAYRAARMLGELRKALESWYADHAAYDPAFAWWVRKPHEALASALESYATFLNEKIAGAENPDAIVGDPVGRERLMDDLDLSLIPYTPEELIAIGERDMAWCRAEMERAVSDMGLGDDWRAALERCKEDHVGPGEQRTLVADLAREAVCLMEERDLLTVPPLAREGWRTEMIPPDKQKLNPFFWGGPVIGISYPADAMEHAAKLMSMRGNNRHFSRATVQHELIPGHYLQHFCQERYRPYRRVFYTPFWTEGWTLYWEMRLWELGFPRTPEERMGMLFWRIHRCARIVFSLRFHLGQMSPAECVEMLVHQVGHERDTATAEVRRSFGGDYDVLYQCAYHIGGLQMRALHREIVEQRGWTERAFHDAVMRENCMPIAVLRAILSGQAASDETCRGWRFADAGA